MRESEFHRQGQLLYFTPLRHMWSHKQRNYFSRVARGLTEYPERRVRFSFIVPQRGNAEEMMSRWKDGRSRCGVVVVLISKFCFFAGWCAQLVTGWPIWSDDSLLTVGAPQGGCSYLNAFAPLLARRVLNFWFINSTNILRHFFIFCL